MTAQMTQADVIEWARTYDGPKFHSLLTDSPYHLTSIVKRFGGATSVPAQYGKDGAFARASLCPLLALYFSIGVAVAWFTQGYEVRQLVSLFVSLHAKQAEGADMMDALTGISAILAGVIIALQGLSALRLPVRAAIIIAAVNILGMVYAMAVLVSTQARAILASALVFSKLGLINLKGFTAIQAHTLNNSVTRPRFDGRILTFWRAVFPTTMRQAPGLSLEWFTTIAALQGYAAGINSGISGLPSKQRDTTTFHRAEFRLVCAVRLHIEGVFANLAINSFHS